MTNIISHIKLHLRLAILPMVQMSKLLSTSDRVFDIGCGQGQFIKHLVVSNVVSHITGVEITEDLINSANKNLSSLPEKRWSKITLYDGKHIPKRAIGHNVWSIIDVLHHVESHNLDQFVKSIVNSMNKDTYLLIKDIDAKSPLVVFNKLHDFLFSGKPGHEIEFKEIIKLLKKYGLEIQHSSKVTSFIYPHFIILCRKKL